MYRGDTDDISELRKRDKADRRVIAFFNDASSRDVPLYLAAVTIGELRRGVALIHHRSDLRQAQALERRLDALLAAYDESILPFDADD